MHAQGPTPPGFEDALLGEQFPRRRLLMAGRESEAPCVRARLLFAVAAP